MIRSRLRSRRNTKTVDVINKTLSGGYAESNAYTGLTATYEQRDAFELITEAGGVIKVTDVFWFEPATPGASLPTITEAQLLYDGSTRYEIIQVQTQGGGNSRMRVMTRRMR